MAQNTTILRELIIRTPDGSARTIRLDKDRITLGRASTNELCFPDDAGLSRQHLVLECSGGNWTVRDLGSKNGTFVNGQRINDAYAVTASDRMAAGHLTMELSGPAADANKTVVFVESPTSATSGTVSASLHGLEERDKLQGVAQAEALVRAGAELSKHTKSLPELFKMILDLSIDAVCASRGVLLTAENGEIAVQSIRGEGLRISSLIRDRVLKDRESVIIRDTRLDAVLSDRVSIVEQQIRSMIAAPLQTDERVIGMIYLDSPHFVREFTKEDLNLLTVMANIAAVRIEHARLAEVEQSRMLLAKELDQAAEIQQRLLPSAAPSVAGVELAGFNAPCRTVGGDYYDFFPYPDGRVGLLVADVSGKGMPAALLMSNLQARVQVLFDSPDDLAKTVTKLNRIVTANCPGNRFITFFIGVLDPRTGEFTYCNAGHNPPLLMRAGGAVETLQGTGIVLGILPQAQYEERTCRLERDDMVVLFSDGVTEAARAADDEDFGEQRLGDTLAELRGHPAADVIEAVQRRVAEFTQGAPPADDITIVIARRL